MKHFYFIFLTLLLSSCSGDDNSADNCVEYHSAGVEDVNAAATIDSSGYPFLVHFRVYNGCGQFGSFVETKAGNEITIEVIAKYECCICTDDAPLRAITYIFNETASGTYILKFKKQDGSFIAETILIE